MTTNIGQTSETRRSPNADLKRSILRRMKRDKSVRVWTPNDFLALGSRSAIDKALQRLALAGDIRRIDRGLYDVPRLNSLTGKPNNPDYTAVIDAVARREKARLLPDGITAANLTAVFPGLSTCQAKDAGRVAGLGGVSDPRVEIPVEDHQIADQ